MKVCLHLLFLYDHNKLPIIMVARYSILEIHHNLSNHVPSNGCFSYFFPLCTTLQCKNLDKNPFALFLLFIRFN